MIARITFFNNDGHQDLVMLGLELSNKTERRRDREREFQTTVVSRDKLRRLVCASLAPLERICSASKDTKSLHHVIEF